VGGYLPRPTVAEPKQENIRVAVVVMVFAAWSVKLFARYAGKKVRLHEKAAGG
jgi:hypothetical protein